MGKIQMNSDDRAGGSFSSGFLFGLLIGGAAVFLLGTKRGKKLLRIALDEGLDGICKVLDRVDKGIGLDDILEEGEMSYSKMPAKTELKKDKEHFSHEKLEEIVKEEKPRVKRFFKGISRRLN